MKTALSKTLALVLSMALLLALGACASPSAAPADPGTPAAPAGAQKVGIAMPTRSLQRWNQDGDYLKAEFEKAGFEVDLQYGGENEVAMQVSQIENMINGGCTLLVIAAIDSTSLGEVLASAKEKNIPVIAHDRMIMETDAVSYYATFNNQKVGTLQGTYLEEKLNLKAGGGPYNIEFFTGDPGDNNIIYFYGGAMEVLQPYLDSGVLVCPSGQTERSVVATVEWKTENAQARMENLITAQGYGPSGTKLDAVMCSNDSTAQGATNALVNAGYTADNFPLVTGQDCDIVSVKNMIAGTQSMSVFKNTDTLAAQVATMAVALLKGETVPVNTNTDNIGLPGPEDGERLIPTFECDPVFADSDNYRELLIDSGYYTEADIA